jgi:hypothetical protein
MYYRKCCDQQIVVIYFCTIFFDGYFLDHQILRLISSVLAEILCAKIVSKLSDILCETCLTSNISKFASKGKKTSLNIYRGVPIKSYYPISYYTLRSKSRRIPIICTVGIQYAGCFEAPDSYNSASHSYWLTCFVMMERDTNRVCSLWSSTFAFMKY